MLNYWRGDRHPQYIAALELFRIYGEQAQKIRTNFKSPPKSGKRIIAEIIACLLFNDCHNDDEELCKMKI